MTRANDRSATGRGAPETGTPVTVAYGDGIGPEIMEATLRILEAAGAPLRYDADRDRGEDVPAGPYLGDRAGGVGDDPPQPGLPEGAHHHPAGGAATRA